MLVLLSFVQIFQSEMQKLNPYLSEILQRLNFRNNGFRSLPVDVDAGVVMGIDEKED